MNVKYTETNDCTVVALSQAFDITYDAAHKLCESYGREPRQGFHVSAKLMGDLRGKVMVLPHYTGKTVSSVFRTLDSKSVYLCLVRSHMFCIKNNQSCDGLDNSRKRVEKIFKVIAL